MLGIHSLIWTICHKLLGFYRNADLFDIIFTMTPGKIFGHLCHMGTLTVNKMALPSMYQRRWCHILALIETNMIALGVQRFPAGAIIQYASHTPETGELSLVLWSTVSQNLRPLGAAQTMWIYFTLCQQSTLRFKTHGAFSIGGFGQTDGQRKFELGIPQNWGVSCIRGASYIRGKTVSQHQNSWCPGFLHCQVIRRISIDNSGWMSLYLFRGGFQQPASSQCREIIADVNTFIQSSAVITQ